MAEVPGKRRAPSRTVLIAGGLVVVVAVVGIGVAVSRSRNTKHQATATTSSSPVASGAPQSGPITFTTLQSRMGLTTGAQLWSSTPAQIDTQISGVAAAGAKWLRTAVRWSGVEPTSADHDDWSLADRIVDDAQHDHVALILDIDGAPKWAGAAQSGEFSTNPQLFATFAAKVAQRYRGRVRVFELGNEPNLINYVPHPDPAAYAGILKATYPAIKAVDPSAFVLTAGLAGGRDHNGNILANTYVSDLYHDGAKGFFDALAFHPYTYPLLPTQDAAGAGGGRNWSMMLKVRQVMVDNGDAAKPVWLTEFGAPTSGPGGVSEAQQAAILKNGFELWKTYPWAGVISWFDFQDKGTDTSTHKDFFGLVTPSGTHKPAYATYAALAKT